MPKKSKLTNQDIVFSLLRNEYYKKNLVYLQENDSFLFWENGQYRYLSDEGTHTFLLHYVCENFPQFNISKNALNELRYLTKLLTPMTVYHEDNNYLAFKDKLFNIKTFRTEEKSRDVVTTMNLPFNYDDIVAQETPRFHQYLQETFVDSYGNTDENLINLIQEMFGSILIPDMAAARAWFLVGSGANGKTVLTNLFEMIFPSEVRSAMNLATLTTERFAKQHLVGKRLNISTEEESKYIKSDTFKSMVFGDTIYAERKYGGDFNFAPRVKFIFSTNRMPSMGSVNEGLKRRMMIIPFNNHVPESKQDPFLNEKLKEELPGILYWGLLGAQQLMQNEYKFTTPDIVRKEMDDFVSDSSSPIGFIKENYVVDPNEHISNVDLYNHYQQWCVDTGRKYVSKANFLKEICTEYNISPRKKRYGTTVTTGLPLITQTEYEQRQQTVESFE